MLRMLPFTPEEFFGVFVQYNEGVWPMQWVLTAVAAAVLLLALCRAIWRDRVIALLLGVLWAWVAIAYHVLHFSRINPAAWLFAAAFLAQAALFAWWAISDRPLECSLRLDFRGGSSACVIAYALIVYPLLSARLGHRYPSTPTFGVPCPTTIFTLGMLITARAGRTGILFIVPLLWSVIGGSAAFLLGVWQDLGLIVSASIAAAFLGTGWFVARFRRHDGIFD